MSPVQLPISFNKQWLSIALIVLTTTLIIFLLVISKNEVKATTPIEKHWDVNDITAAPGFYAPSLQLFGTLESPATTTLTSKIGGIINDTPKLDGQHIEKGEVLIAIDPSEAQRISDQRLADLKEAEANLASEQVRNTFNKSNLKHEEELLALTQKSVDRITTLNRKKLSAESDLETALITQTQQALRVNQSKLSIANHKNQIAILEARVLRSKAAFQQAQDDLLSATVIAPFNARISQLHVSKGNRIQNGSSLVTLFSTEQLELRVHIPEYTANQIKKQLADFKKSPEVIYAHATVDTIQYKLPFNRLAGEVQQGAGGVDAIFTFEEEVLSLPIGKTLSITLKLPQLANVVVVPASSIYQQKYIYTIEDQKLHSLPVERLGYWHNPDKPNLTFWIIKSELKKGDKVLSSLLPNAIDGLRVKIHDQ